MTEINLIFEHDGGELGIDEKKRLYWNGKRIQVEKTFTLKPFQRLGAIITVFSAFVVAVIAVLNYLQEYGACLPKL